MTFDFYKQFVRDSTENGTMKFYEDESCTKPLTDDYFTDFDLAVRFAIYEIVEREGLDCQFSADDIYYEISRFAPELLEALEVEK